MTREIRESSSGRAVGAAFAGVLVLAAVLRVVDLEGRTMWCDELLSIRRASLGFGPLIRELLKVEHAPLYETTLSVWLKFGRSDAWIRLLSSLYGIATIGVVYAAFRLLTTRRLALGVALLTAVSPLHVYWSRIARPYALLPLVSWAATYFLFKLLDARRGGRGAWVGYVVCAALCLYTHYFGVLLLFAHTLVFAAASWRPGRRKRLGGWAAAQAAVLLLFSPWLAGNFATTVGAAKGQVYYASQLGLLFKLAYFFFVFSLGWTVSPFCWPLVVPAAALYGWAFVRGTAASWLGPRAREARIALALFAVPLLAGWFVPACSPKHQTPGVPLYAFIVLCALASLRPRWMRVGLFAVMLALDAGSLTNYFRNAQYTDVDVVTPWRAIVAEVEARARPSDAVVLGYNPAPFLWYYRGAAPVYRFVNHDLAQRTRYHRFQVNHGARWIRFGSGRDVQPEDCDALLRRHGRLWFVLFRDDPRAKMEAWMRRAGRVVLEKGYQLEEETLRGLKEGWRCAHKYQQYYYKLYLVTRSADAGKKKR